MWGFGVGTLIVCVFAVLHFGLGRVPVYFVLIGLLSLASILNEMLASYVSLNSFTQLTMTGTNTRVVYKWDPKSGSLTLI